MNEGMNERVDELSKPTVLCQPMMGLLLLAFAASLWPLQFLLAHLLMSFHLTRSMLCLLVYLSLALPIPTDGPVAVPYTIQLTDHSLLALSCRLLRLLRRRRSAPEDLVIHLKPALSMMAIVHAVMATI